MLDDLTPSEPGVQEPPCWAFTPAQLEVVEGFIVAATENQGGPNATLAEAIAALGVAEAPNIDWDAEDAEVAFAGQVMDDEMIRMKADWQSQRDWKRWREANPTAPEPSPVHWGAIRMHMAEEAGIEYTADEPIKAMPESLAYLGNKTDEVLERMATAATASYRASLAKLGLTLPEDEPSTPIEKAEDMKKTDDEPVVRLATQRDEARRTKDGDGSRENPFREKGAYMLKQILEELGVEVRRNIRAHVIEFLETSTEEADPKWKAASDGATADLRERIAKKFWFKARTSPEASRLRFTREAWTDYLNAIGYHAEVDPFLVWLSELPAWDQTPRIEFILADLFGAEDDDLTRWASRAPLIGAVQRARFPGSKIDESPILVSVEQGLGKSTMASSLVPPEYKDDWFGDALDLSSSKKEQAEALAGCVVVEISELDGLRRAEIGAVKSFLARTNDGQHRGAYAIAKEKKPRRCVIIGTSNDEQCLANDPSGNRRLVPIILLRTPEQQSLTEAAGESGCAGAKFRQR